MKKYWIRPPIFFFLLMTVVPAVCAGAFPAGAQSAGDPDGAVTRLSLNNDNEVLRRAVLALNQQNFGSARDFFGILLNNNPANLEGWAGLLLARVDLGEDPGGLRQEYQRRLKEDPDDYAALFSLGLLSELEQDPVRAEVYYRKAAGLAPAPALACARLIYLRRDRLSREDARDIRSLVSRPVTDDGYWTHICSAIYYWALAAREKDGQKLGYARKAALRAQEIRPYEDDAYLFLGLIDVAAGHTARAERVLNEARKVAPLDSGISLLLANISLRQGYWQPAESDLLQAKKGLTLSDRMAGLDKKVEKLLAVSRQAQDLNPLVGIIGAFLILIVSIILHELAHGWTALKSGDPTARNEGRLSLNPLVHIDPFGTVLLPAVLFLVHSAVLIGWAKPVPVNSAYFRRPRRDEARVALAGPAMNLLIGLCCLLGLAAAGLYLKSRGYEAYDFGTLGSPALVVGGDGAVFWAYAVSILKSGVLISGILAGLNLLPIPPLDGSHVLRALLPFRWVDPVFDFLSRWGLLAVVALAFLGGLDYLLLPAFTVTQALTAFVAGTLGLG